MPTPNQDTNDLPPQYHQIQCAACQKSFFWHLAYWQSRTPGSQDPAGYDYISRVFCPHCGAIVCQGYGAGNWAWTGDNQFLNASKAFPPTVPPDLEWLPDDERGEKFMENFHAAFGKRQLPREMWVPVTQQRLDLSRLGTFTEIPFKRRQAPLHQVFLAKLREYFAWLIGKQNELPRREQRAKQSVRGRVSNLRRQPTSGWREIFFHEDDYGMIEVLPLANWDICISRLREVGKSSEAHAAEIGWTNLDIRGDYPQPLELLKINVNDLAASLSKFLVAYDQVLTGYSSFREIAEDTIAFGTEEAYIIFADYNPLNGFVEDLWLDFGTEIQSQSGLILQGLQYLGSLGALLLVDWDLGQLINLSDQEALTAYLALQAKRQAQVKHP